MKDNTEFLTTLEGNLRRLERQCDNYFSTVCEDYKGVRTSLSYKEECSYIGGAWVCKDLVVKLKGNLRVAKAGNISKTLKFNLDVVGFNVDYVGDGLIVDIIRMYLEGK